MQDLSRPQRRLVGLLFVAGLLILVDQSADLTATVMARKIELGVPAWRFGFFGLLASRTSVLLLADVMLFASVLGLEWRRMLKVLGVLHLALGAVCLAGVALFLLDTVQLRGTVPAASTSVFSAATFRAGVVGLAAGLTLAAAGIAALRVGSDGSRGRRSSKPPVLVTESRAARGT